MARNTVFLVLAAVVLVSPAAAEVLWDNGLIFGGRARAISPPAFPDIRVVDDIVVPDGPGWRIEGFHAGIIEDDEWEDGGITEIYVFDSANDEPGDLLLQVQAPHEKMDTGDEYFGRAYYLYWVPELALELAPGTYWIGLRQPNGGGKGSSYWATSNGGIDGSDSSNGYFSIDRGGKWNAEGVGYHHAFVLEGGPIPEPTTGLTLLTGTTLALVGRRRTRRG